MRLRLGDIVPPSPVLRPGHTQGAASRLAIEKRSRKSHIGQKSDMQPGDLVEYRFDDRPGTRTTRAHIVRYDSTRHHESTVNEERHTTHQAGQH